MVRHNMISYKLIIESSGETFGCLLRDKNLNIVKDGDMAKMYNILARPTPENAVVRDFNLETLSVSTSTAVMTADSTGWASVHYALKITDDFYILFFTTGTRTIRAAISNTYNGTFSHVLTSQFVVVGDNGAWDSAGVEQDVGARKISEDEQYIYYWMLYSNVDYYGVSHQGWYKVRIDKINKTINYIEKYANNPIVAINQVDYSQNRVGGSNVETTIDGKYAMYHMVKNVNVNDEKIAFSISDDSMFSNVIQKEIIGDKLTFASHPNELYMEKFDFYYNSLGQLVLIYEDVFDAVDNLKYGVGARIYNITVNDTEIEYITIYLSGQLIKIPLTDDKSPMLIYINGKIKYIHLVDTNDANASNLRIFLDGRIKSIKKV